MHRQLNILLIEDDEAFALLVTRTLKRLKSQHEVCAVTRLSDAICQLGNRKFDLVLTDLSLPDAVRLESVRTVRAAHPELPLVVLTLLESSELISEALQTGAQDFIVKDSMTPESLERSIQNAVERQKLVAENTVLIERLRSQQQELNGKNARLKQLIETAHRFADNVSHEFRTPLTVIREYAALVREGLLGEVNEQQSEFMDVIIYRVDDLNRMVDDMLDSSKLEAGIMGTYRVSTDAADIIRSPLEGLQLKAQVRGVKLSCDIAPDLPRVYCDPEKAGRVVTNLAANAIKFTEDGQGHVHVEIRPKLDDGDVEISISDNGPGINPDDLKRMFKRFQQLGTCTQSSTKGFGLGLNIARELVDLNYGTIAVESKVECGTTFRFTVPVDNWPEIVSRYCNRLSVASENSRVAVVHVAAVGDFTEAGCRDTESFWRFTQRQTDLIRRLGSSDWVLLVACGPDEIEMVIDRFRSEHAEVSRNRPLPLPALEFQNSGCFLASDVQTIQEVACPEAECLV
ncbi:hybrid sensor histidine kinase/response regulator [Fuerstiella marisgermanici]|uniref:histidine kinase n=1 Tax=Fuerstiella marisgermanici TaxID=1891926 RepID=A0A1P8WA94_9PLAN|nr:hybrid sensor histidine kinase/response regulator [Fuerstiella marisgermanici]APZ90982.1 Histidine protein kinase DivJ [Fuerstiella marisgermanici]